MADNLESIILRQVAEVSQTEVAKALGRDPSQTSRIFSNDQGLRLEQLEPFFAALKLKVVVIDGEAVTISRAEYDALRVLARKYLSLPNGKAHRE